MLTLVSLAARSFRLTLLGLLPVAALAQAPTISNLTPSTAAPGATVTITGTNLTGFTAVMLNGQEVRATAGATPATTATFIVPAASGTGRVRLTTPAGTALSGFKLGVTRASSSKNYGLVSNNATGATATGGYSTPVASDLDKDGRLEMLVGQGDGTMICYEQASANGAFSPTGTLITFATGGATVDVGNFAKPMVSDLDGDGLQEIIVGEELGKVLVYEQATSTGGSAFKVGAATTLFANPYGVPTSAAPNGGSYAKPTVGDLDSDGLIDILVGSNNGLLIRYEQLAAGNATAAGFSIPTTVKMADGTNLDAGAVSKPLITDYDGDGKLDMLVGNLAGNVLLYTQTAVNALTFSFVQNLSTGGTDASVINMGNTGTNPSSSGGYAAPAVTDYDGDGLLDLFLGNGTGTVYRYEQAVSATSPVVTAPLPVVLTSFTAQATATGNRLSWATAQEVNSARFVVEASATGETFAAIATLAAAGNTTSLSTYGFVDASETALSASRRYYRLRQEDLDGKVNYSPVVSVSRAAAASTASKTEAYPNPFADRLAVALPGQAEPQATTVTLLNLAGRPVFSTTLSLSAAPQALTALPELPAGVYILRVATATGSTSQKVVRQ
ncbi:T9SS type A sorting domain-containing protein [Hymenobacter glaciei]